MLLLNKRLQTVHECLNTIKVQRALIKYLLPNCYQGYSFCGEEYLLDLNFELKSHKAANVMKIILAVCRLVRYRKIRGKKRKKNAFAGSRYQRKLPLIYNRKFFRSILKSGYVFLNFTTARIIAPTFNKCGIYFCGRKKSPCRV